MLEKLKNPKARKNFLAWCVVAIIASGILNYYLDQVVKPEYQSCVIERNASAEDGKGDQGANGSTLCSEWKGFVVNIGTGTTVQFISASIVALFFLGVLALVKEDEEAIHDVEILYQPEQKRRHMESLSSTTFWFHDGHLASWVRRNVLPRFINDCRNDMAKRTIKAAILDPTNDNVCGSYISHIQGLPKGEQRFPDIESLKAELCATIYVFSKSTLPSHLEIDLFLKSSIDYIRDDINSTCAFWTTVGGSSPAIVFRNRNNRFLYYNLMAKNFNTSIKEYRTIDLSSAAQVYDTVKNKPEQRRIAAVLRSVFPNWSIVKNDDFIKKVERQTT